MIQSENWESLPVKTSRMKSRMMPSEEKWKNWWKRTLKQPKRNRRSIMMRSLVHHHASVLAAQYWKRTSQERNEEVHGKLDYHWQGPYTITAALGKGLFQLKELNGDKVGSSCASRWNYDIHIPNMSFNRQWRESMGFIWRGTYALKLQLNPHHQKIPW